MWRNACGRLSGIAAGWRDRPLHLVYGMLNTKAAQGFLEPLAPFTETLRAVGIPGEAASLSAAGAAAHGANAGFKARTCQSVLDAVHDIATQETPGRILICGSLYLAGHVLAEND